MPNEKKEFIEKMMETLPLDHLEFIRVGAIQKVILPRGG